MKLPLSACLSLLVLLLSWPICAQTPILRDAGITHPQVSSQGMVATQHYLASQVGADILARGGNAVDAADE